MKKAIRLSDVAAAAGVSLGTASNTFNRPTLVRTQVRELVQEAAQRLGYSGPDPIGRLLMGAKAHTGPIGGLPGIGERIAILDERRQKFMHQMGMRTAVPGSLREAQVGLLPQVIDSFRREPTDRRR